jgi:hypothetical protein
VPKKPYPLEALRTLRKRTRDEAQGELAGAQAALEQAEACLREATQALQAQVSVRAKQNEARFERAADLVRAAAFDGRLHAEVQALVLREGQARQEVRTRERAVRVAREALRAAYGEQQVIERHHERFVDEERKRRDKADELEEEDLLAHREAKRRRQASEA